MAHFILEIGTEEMPARFLPGLNKNLIALLKSELQEAKIDFGQISSFSTPRRLVVSATEVAEQQRQEEVEVTGPPTNIAFDEDGKPKPAGLGFARSQGVDFSEVYRLQTPKGEYLAVLKQVGGGKSQDILSGICCNIVFKLPFPKKMNWEKSRFTFGRPLRWFLALLDSELVDFEIAGLRSSNLTYGHRVMAPGPFEVARADQFFSVLKEKAEVVLNVSERMEIIKGKADKLAQDVGGKITWSESLLAQVGNLVEYPEPVLGRFDEKFLALPKEVLLTSMESHQKSFGLEDEKGQLLPYFLTVINLQPEQTDLVRKGWERVLRARLEDARFFWEADSQKDFDFWLNKLDQVIFLAPLGTMGDKSRRLQSLCGQLADLIKPEIKTDMQRAGRLAKADLVSEMVGEFDDLQGMMGGIYARNKGESEVVAQGIYEQYLPSGQDSPVPSSIQGSIVSLADKLDTLVGCFGLKKMPTGAADPYALRRQALGICRIVLHHGLRLDLKQALQMALDGYSNINWKLQPEENLQSLLEFFAQRLKAFWGSQGYETKIIDAAINAGIYDIWALEKRLQALRDFSSSEHFEQAVLTFKRADNIIRKQSDMALDGQIDNGLLQEQPEIELADKIQTTSEQWQQLWNENNFARLLDMLLELRPFVDNFFDNVMVMCEDEKLRLNRLNLLQTLVSRLGGLADFSALQV